MLEVRKLQAAGYEFNVRLIFAERCCHFFVRVHCDRALARSTTASAAPAQEAEVLILGVAELRNLTSGMAPRVPQSQPAPNLVWGADR
jgi:hypothetical protein